MDMSHKPRPTAADFHPEVLRLFDQYVHGLIDRRGFLDRAARYASGGVTAAALLAALSPDFAMGQMTKADDARIKGEFVEIPSPAGNGKIRAYVTRPAQAAGALPVVLVVHENRGLNPHIEDVTRRLAVENFIAVAPDALTTAGGYPGDEDKAREAFAKLDLRKVAEDFVASAQWARGVAGSNGKLGAVGFCYGGGVVNMLATRVPELVAGAPFYGPAPALDAVGNIKAELCVIFADNDERINAGWPAYKDTLEVAGVKFQAFKYPGTQHGFHNDTTPRYDQNAARAAWARVMELFNRRLRA
jgi:carboxymethylenebutenolidase